MKKNGAFRAHAIDFKGFSLHHCVDYMVGRAVTGQFVMQNNVFYHALISNHDSIPDILNFNKNICLMWSPHQTQIPTKKTY